MKIQIQCRQKINQTLEKTYQVIANLNTWNTWSPWFHCEPTCKTATTGATQAVGQKHEWSGEIIGAGQMTTDQLIPNELIQFQLEFFKPWKNKAVIRFEIKKISIDTTEVTWSMTTQLPFFMFFFKKMVMSYMIHDFNRGLLMLKDLVETDQVLSRSVFKDVKSFNGFQVIGRKITTQISQLSSVMPGEFHELLDKVKLQQLPEPQTALSFTHEFDVASGQCEVTAGFVYPPGQALKVPKGYQLTVIPAHRGLLVDHFGAYHHLGNGWGMAMAHLRGLKKKINKKIPLYEVYVTLPDQCEIKDLHTEVVIPIN